MSSYDRTPGRRRTVNHYQAEEQALTSLTREAESRLAEARAARTEARHYRMRELDKQQKEMDEQSDRVYKLQSGSPRSSVLRTSVTRSPRESTLPYVARRGSGDSMASERVELREKLNEIEDKLKQCMLQNAQFDNEKSFLQYQVEVLKDDMEETETVHLQLKREHRKTCNELQFLKRDFDKLQGDLAATKSQLEERDRLIEEHNLVLIGDDADESRGGRATSNGPRSSSEKSGTPRSGAGGEFTSSANVDLSQRTHALISKEAARILNAAAGNSLDEKLKHFDDEKEELLDRIRRLEMEVTEERQKSASRDDLFAKGLGKLNGPDAQLVAAAQKEANQRVAQNKLQLQKAEQENSTLRATILRLEGQVKRYTTAAKEAETAVEELKKEKRNLQRDLRDGGARSEELESELANTKKRLEKLKASRSLAAAAVAGNTR